MTHGKLGVALVVVIAAILLMLSVATVELPDPQQPVAESDRPALIDVELSRPEGLAKEELTKSRETSGPQVHGRAVRAEDGGALKHVLVEMRDLDNRYCKTHTDDEGRFAFPAGSATDASFVVHAEGRVRKWHQTKLWQLSGEEQDLGFVRIEPAVRLQGRVIDQHGVPLAGCSLDFERHDGTWSNSTASDDAGRFEMRELLRPGRYVFSIRWPWRNLGTSEFVVPMRPGAHEIQLRVERPASRDPIRGRVVDERGNPRAGFIVETKVGHRAQKHKTAADGSFVITAPPGVRERTPVRVFAAEYRPMQVLRPIKPVRWGSRIEVVVRCEQKLRLFVHSRGVPVEQYFVRLISLGGGVHIKDWRVRRAVGEHPGGRATVDNVLPGKNKLVVVPQRTDLYPSEELEIDITPELGTLAVEVRRRAKLVVRVVDAADRPVTESDVLLFVTPRSKAPENGSLAAATRDSFANRAPIRIDSGRTNGDGICELSGPSEASNPYVKVTGAKHVPCVRDVAPGVTSLTVRVRAPRRIRGRISPLSAIAELFPTKLTKLRTVGTKTRANYVKLQMPHLRVHDRDGTRIARVVVADDGSFAFRCLSGKAHVTPGVPSLP